MQKKDEILIANYYALAWWEESLTKKHFESPEFKALPFDDEFVKSRLIEGQANLALIMPSLYVALVIPKETLFNEYQEEFDAIDRYLLSRVETVESTYASDTASKIAFVRHIRNAVGHADAEFTSKGILFRDKNPQKTKEKFHAELSFAVLSELVHALQGIILKRVVAIQKNQVKAAD